ncbi:MAG TPA: TolC family protein [Flavobacterium sp.]|jgi:outer membrane protein
MKNKNIYLLRLLLLFFSYTAVQGQTKKWTLKECVGYAIANNISVKQADLDIQDVNIDKRAAIGNFLPTVNANASHSWNIGLNQNITTGLLENQTSQFTSGSLNVNITIYNGLQNQNRLRRSKLSMIAAQYRSTKIRDDISLNVANAFLQILFNKENLKVQQEQEINNQKQMERTRQLVEAGSVPRGDLLDIQATVAGSRQAVVTAENTLLISKLSLAQLLQLKDFETFDIDDQGYNVEDTTMLEPPSSILEKARQQRVELKIAKINLEIAERDIKIAKGGYQPSLQGFYSFSSRVAYSDRIIGVAPDANNPFSVIGQVQGTGESVIGPNLSPVLRNPASFFDQFSDNKGQSFGVQLTIPILNGFSVRNAVERSKVSYERSRIASQQAELDLERNVYTAITDARGALNAYEAAVAAAEARTEAFNYARERFAVGLMNAFDLSQAQTLYVNSQSDVIRTKYEYIFRVKVVNFYSGIPIIQN